MTDNPPEPANPPAEEPPAPQPPAAEQPPPRREPPPADAKAAEPKAAETQTAAGERTINIGEQQVRTRADTEDAIRVMNQFAEDLPEAYIHNADVKGDWHIHINGGGAAKGEVYPPPPRDTADVDTREIQKIKAVYLRHAAYPTALARLKEAHCVVLRGAPKVGKRAAAIFLATELGRADLTIRELSPDDDLAAQVRFFEKKGVSVLMVDGLLAAPARGLTQRIATDLLNELTRCGGYLIICAQPGVPLPNPLPEVALRPFAAERTRDLVARHLDHYGSFSEEETAAALADPGIADILKDGLPPAQADQLAKLIAEELRSDADDAPKFERALRGFTAAADEAVAAWFDAAADDVSEAAFRIALAVFSGARYAAVLEAARDLEKRLQPEPPRDEKSVAAPTPSPFLRDRRTQRLEKAAAQIIKRPQPVYYSDAVEIEVVEMKDPRYPRALLRYLWNEFDDVRRPLLDWLKAYAVDPRSADVRQRAAGAIGALAALDFHTIQQEAFVEWAAADYESGQERRLRFEALANALVMLLWNDAVIDKVLALLDAWRGSRNQIAPWAAARAYAKIGLRYPRKAMSEWRAILEAGSSIHLRLSADLVLILRDPERQGQIESIVDAIISLFLHAVELPHSLRRIYEPALEGLAAWVEADAKEPGSEQIGLPLFLALTAIKLPPDNTTEPPETWPPAMLTIVGTQPDSTYRRILAGLLRGAFRDPNWQPQAAEVLRAWVRAADRDDWLAETLAAVLKEWLALPGAGERERGLLRMHLTRMRTLPKEPLPVAGRLLSELGLAAPASTALIPTR